MPIQPEKRRGQFQFTRNVKSCGRKGGLGSGEICYYRFFKRGENVEGEIIGQSRNDTLSLRVRQNNGIVHTIGLAKGSPLTSKRKHEFSEEERATMLVCAKKTDYPSCALPFYEKRCLIPIDKRVMKAFSECMTKGEEEGEPIELRKDERTTIGWQKLFTPQNILVGVLGAVALYFGYQYFSEHKAIKLKNHG